MADSIDNQNTNDGRGASQRRAQTNKDTQEPQAALPIAQPDQQARNPTPPLSQRRRRKCRCNIGTIIELFVGCALIGVGCLQYTDYSRQAGIMGTQTGISVATNRAFVVPTGLKWDSVVDKNTGNVTWNIYAMWQNSGNTPTHNLHTKVVRAFAVAIQNFDDPLWSNFDIVPEEIDKSIAGFLGPKASMDGGPLDISGTDLLNVQTRNTPLVIGGIARYESTLRGDVKHVTKFCFFVVNVRGNPLIADTNLTSGIRLCKASNCADDECEAQPR